MLVRALAGGNDRRGIPEPHHLLPLGALRLQSGTNHSLRILRTFHFPDSIRQDSGANSHQTLPLQMPELGNFFPQILGRSRYKTGNGTVAVCYHKLLPSLNPGQILAQSRLQFRHPYLGHSGNLLQYDQYSHVPGSGLEYHSLLP